MAAKYAIGAGGNWTADTTWSTTDGGSNDTTKPTAADDVFLTSNSGNVVIDAASVCRSLNCTGFTGSFTHSAGATFSLGDGTAGASNIALKLVSGMTATLSSGITFQSTSSTHQTIDWAGKVLGNVTFTGTGSYYQLLSSMTNQFTSGTITLTVGTLDLNGYAASWGIFSSSGTGVRSLISGNATIALNKSSATSWDITTATNMTLTLGTTVISVNGTTATFIGNNLTYASITFGGGGTPVLNANGATITTLTRTGGDFSIIQSCTITNFVCQSEAAARTITITAAKTITSTAAGFLVNGSSGKLVSLLSSSAGSAWNLSVPSGNVSCSYVSIKDSAAAGGATFTADANSTNVSGNSGWTFLTNSRNPSSLSMLGVG